MKKRLQLVLALTLIFGILTSCTAPQSGTEAPTESSEVPETVTDESPDVSSTPEIDPQLTADFLSDYETMWDYMENNYALYDAAQRITGQDFHVVKEIYRQVIPSIRTAPEFYHKVVTPCMQAFNWVGHAYILTYDYYSELMRESEGWEDITPSIENNLWIIQDLFLPQVREFYENTLVTQRTSAIGISASSTVPLNSNFEKLPGTSSNLTLGYYEESIAYIKIKGMTQPCENNDGEMLDTFFAEIEEKGCQDCIIDIRSNHGGYDVYWMSNIILPNAKGIATAEYYCLIKGETSIKRLEEAGYDLLPIEEFPLEQFPNINPDDLQSVDRYLIRSTTIGRDASVPPVYTGKIWILTDSFSYSSADRFAAFCQRSGFATLVGEPTGGAGTGLDPISVKIIVTKEKNVL